MAALYLRFYGTFAPATFLVTIACAWLYYTWGGSTLPALLFFKLITDYIFWYVLKELNEKKMYYYYNRNLAKYSLWLFAFIFDFLLLISLLALVTPRPISI